MEKFSNFSNDNEDLKLEENQIHEIHEENDDLKEITEKENHRIGNASNEENTIEVKLEGNFNNKENKNAIYVEKSPSRYDTNSMNNTANNRFYNTKLELNNDSALSSFHIHNINNNKEKLKIPKSIKEKTIKIPKKENLGTQSAQSVKSEYSLRSKKNSTHNENNPLHIDNNIPNVKDKKIQINSLSLSNSKDRENDSDKEYTNEQPEYKDKQNRVIEHKEDSNIPIPMNDFSKSGTFKSQTNANDYSYSNNNNRQEYYTENTSMNNTNSNFNINNKNYVNRYNSSNYSNFYKDQSGKNFSETISDLQSIGKEIPNNDNDSYIDENQRTMKEYEMRSNIYTNKNMNKDDSSINNLIKRDLHEYLSNLQNKQILRVNANKENEWVVKFNTEEENTEDLQQSEVNRSEVNKEKRKMNDTSMKQNSGNFNDCRGIDTNKMRAVNKNHISAAKFDDRKIVEQ